MTIQPPLLAAYEQTLKEVENAWHAQGLSVRTIHNYWLWVRRLLVYLQEQGVAPGGVEPRDLDLKEIMGHQHFASLAPYLHPSPSLQRAHLSAYSAALNLTA